MSLRCFPSSFGSIQLMVWEEMSFDDFQDGHRGGHLGYWNRMILAILNLYITSMPPIKFWFNPTYGLGGDVVWRISRLPPWRPPWISGRTILAILNLNNVPMPPIKFHLNLTYGLGGDVVWRISRWPPWWPCWILEWNNFSNSESLCHCDASHQVLAQSNYGLEEMSFEEFQDGGHLGYRNQMILAILNIYVPPMPSIKFLLNLTYGLGGHLGYRNGTILAILNLFVTVMLPINFSSIQLMVWE